MPEDTVFDAVHRLHAELDEVHDLLTGPGASVRLVLTPENVVLAEARRSYTMLSLFGYRVDGVVVNRIFPGAAGDNGSSDEQGGDVDAWRAGWVRAQADVLTEVEHSFAGLPRWRSVYRASEPVGVAELAALAADAYAGSDPLAQPDGSGPFRVTRTSRGAVLHLALPFVTGAEVGLARNGDELVVSVASYRRLLTLPSGLSRLAVAGARVEGGELQVRFEEGTT
jgi:arsenite-transporting ATPase